MTLRQWAHIPLLLLVLVLVLPAVVAALVMRVTFTLIRYLHRVYMPHLYDRLHRYAEQDAEMTKALWHYLDKDDFLNGWGNVTVCTIPSDEHGWVDLPGGFSGHVPCNGWPRIDCPVHPDSEFAGRPGQKLAVLDVEVVRVNGGVICDTCGKQYRDHPDDPACPWPSFVLLCDGTHAKC